MRKNGLAVHFVRDVIGRHINVPGFLHMLRHGYLRGQGSTRLRRACPELRGADAVRWPFLSIGLWAARMGQIYWRGILLT